jgi:hypothetical protein
VTRLGRCGALPAAGLAVVALASCGGGGDGGAASTSAGVATAPVAPATSATTPEAAAPPSSPADARRARAALLHRADLPDGWTQQETGAGLDDPACAAARRIRDTATAVAQAPSFSHGNASGAEQTVWVFSGAAAAEQAARTLSRPSTRRCLAVALGRRLGGGTEAADPKQAKVTGLRAGVGPGTTAGAVAVTFTYQGSFTSDLRYALVVTRAGRAVAATSFLQLGNGFDATQRRRLSRLTAARLRRAMA